MLDLGFLRAQIQDHLWADITNPRELCQKLGSSRLFNFQAQTESSHSLKALGKENHTSRLAGL